MGFINVLSKFLTGVLFSRDDLSFRSKNFNPLRIIVVSFLVVNLIFTIHLVGKTSNLYDAVEESCPGLIEELKNKKLGVSDIK